MNYLDKIGLEHYETLIRNKLSSLTTQLETHSHGTIDVIEYSSGEMHRNIFRGKNLGSAVTDAQRSAIANNTFDDLYTGDYWVINDITWRIVDINYWLNTGDTAFTTPHLVIMPDTNLYSAQMNATNTTDGGYVGSLMYTTNLESAKTTITDIFGDMVLTHRELLTTATTDGYPSSVIWSDSTIELPNEIMMYGCHIHAATGYGNFIPNIHTVNKFQLALFRLIPKFIHNNRQWFWLRDVVNIHYFANVGYCGNSSFDAANTSGSIGVRPVFAIG